MSITAAIVTFATLWFMVLFCILPVRMKSQAEAGQITPGTPPSAPSDPQLAKRAKITTAITVVLFTLTYLLLASGWITVQNMDVFHVLN